MKLKNGVSELIPIVLISAISLSMMAILVGYLQSNTGSQIEETKQEANRQVQCMKIKYSILNVDIYSQNYSLFVFVLIKNLGIPIDGFAAKFIGEKNETNFIYVSFNHSLKKFEFGLLEYNLTNRINFEHLSSVNMYPFFNISNVLTECTQFQRNIDLTKYMYDDPEKIDLNVYGGSQNFDKDKDGYVRLEYGGKDCNDSNPNVHPNAPEIIGNGIDDDCDGKIDENESLTKYYYDYDGDNYGTSAYQELSAPSGYYRALVSGDCNDSNASINPNATEICGNGIDENCDGKDSECNVSKLIIFLTTITHNGDFVHDVALSDCGCENLTGSVESRCYVDCFCKRYKPTNLECTNIHAFVSIYSDDYPRIMDSKFSYPINVPIYWWHVSEGAKYKIANNWSDMFDGSILVDGQTGTGYSDSLVWSDTKSDGTYKGYSDCDYGGCGCTNPNWRAGANTCGEGHWGHQRYTDGRWLDWGQSSGCDSLGGCGDNYRMRCLCELH